MSMKEFKTGRYENMGPGVSNPEFWEAERIYKTVTLTFGKVGTRGTRASREFTSSEEAQRFVLERLQDKMSEGFVKVEN
jgi:predicted DNA-binding WGR domain protein